MEDKMPRKIRGPSKHTVNRWVAALMPLVMMALVGYATWVFVVLICIKHLLISQHQKPAAIVLVTLYFLLFLLFSAAYLRVLWTIYTNPGFVPKGPDAAQGIVDEKIRDGSDSDPEMGLRNVLRGDPAEFTNPAASGFANDGVSNESLDPRNTPPQDRTAADSMPQPQDPESAAGPPHPGQRVSALLSPIIHQDRPATSSTLQGHPYDSYIRDPPAERAEPENFREWYNKDVFVCEPDGKPRWCWHCNSYKPDRSHHCSEVERCVYKMDHFCPWVGGVVAETSYKFFYQVVVYGTFYCFFLIISIAIMVHGRIEDDNHIDPNWLAALALSSLFGLFSAGMAGSTTQLIYRNLSTVDSLSSTTKVYQLAIHDPNPPLPPPPGQRQMYSPLIPRIWLPTYPVEGEQQRCFAIVKTKQGENPWRLPSTIDNFKEVLGYNVWDWWLPIKQSPTVKKDNTEGFYRWNQELLERLRKEAGIETETTTT